MQTDISIIMGIYNCEKTLSKTIESIINQPYRNWELIMCDDGSTDQTYMIAKKYSESDDRIMVIKNPHNMGLAKTLNNCLKHAQGQYIMRHDGDDLMVEDRMEKQLACMESHGYDVCGSSAYIFDDTGTWGRRDLPEYPSKLTMVTGTPCIHPSVLMKRDKLLEVGGYSDNELTRQRLEDYDLWLKLFENGCSFYNIQEPLIYFREDQNAYKRKKRAFRIAETKARLDACRRLKIPWYRRLCALKPLVVMMIPSRLLRQFHLRSASR